MKVKIPILLLGITVITSCSRPTTSHQNKADIDSIAEAYFQDLLKLYPVFATSIGDNRYDSIYNNDITVSFIATVQKTYTKYDQLLSRMDTSAFNADQLLNYYLLKRDIKLTLEGLQFHDEYMPFDQLNGNIWFFAQMGSGQSIHPFKTYQDYTNFLKRTNGFVAWCDTAILRMQEGMKLGYTKPACVIGKAITQLEGLIVTQPEESVFFGPIKSLPLSFSKEQKDTLTTQYTTAIKNKINPALQRFLSFVKREYYPHCRKTVAISDIPNGKAEYAYMVKTSTTTELKADSIFSLGLSEVARIEKEMETIKTQVGYQGNMAEFLKYAQTDKRFFPFKSGPEVISKFNMIYDRIKPELKKIFHTTPKAGFEIRQVEKFRENTVDAHYEPPSLDGSRKGIFYVPVPNPSNYNYIGMETLFLHEAIPGHHYQNALQQEMTSLPQFRKFGGNSAYMEGWALYAETLGQQLGLYKDPYQYLGHLSDEMLRAVRLVVDVGLHTKGWTREQAISYLKSHVIITDHEAEVAIDRYIVWPGQALSYKIGALKIQVLRKKAETSLGKNFILAEFHDQVLKNGSLPLDVLEMEIDKWITQKLATKK